MFTIPIYQPSLAGNEKKYVNECLDSNWISSKGSFISRFEQQFGQAVGVTHATAVCNGTIALHLAMLTLGIGPGDEVIVPTLTYIASVNAIAYVGATPVFVDSLESTWQMDPSDVERKITSKTRAILAVHLYGHPCDMDALVSIARKHDLFLVEDCAEAFGSLYKGRNVGSFGDIATYSFYGNKTITTGEGGMVTTNDQTLHERAISYKGQGLAKYREYWHDIIGYNFRMTNICAAIGLAQLEQAEQIFVRKRQVADWYRDGLAGLPLILHGESPDARHSYWMCSVLLNDATLRDPLRAYLAEKGIETRPLFYPVHTMPMYSEKYQRHPVAEGLGWRGINLPSWPGLSFELIEYLCRHLREFFQSGGKRA